MNKEIEELLNNLKDENWNYYPSDLIPYKTLLMEERDILLSYIEQLEKRNKELYEGFMATQEELTDYATKNEQLEKENEELKQWDKNKDTRNSRQRVSNAYQIIQNDKLKRCFNTQKRRRKEEAQKKKLYKSRIDKAIEVIDLIIPELWNISNAMTYKLKDIKYILKGGSDE